MPKRKHVIAELVATMPVTEVTQVGGIEFGFRMSMIECEAGGVASGAGMGSPWVIVTWKGRHFGIHAVELLASVLEAAGHHEDAAAVRRAEVGEGITVEAEAGGNA